MTGMIQKIKEGWKRRKFERRVNKMFDVPQGGERRKKNRRSD